VFLPLSASPIVILPLIFNFVILPLCFQNEGVVYTWFLTLLDQNQFNDFKK
jgi:hypothetical protein